MQQRLRDARDNREDGFTLIELLIVIVVLGILATIVVFGVAQFRDDADTAACESNLKTVQVAADAYLAQRGTFPGDIEDLVTGGYLKTYPDGTTANSNGTYTINGANDDPPNTITSNC